MCVLQERVERKRVHVQALTHAFKRMSPLNPHSALLHTPYLALLLHTPYLSIVDLHGAKLLHGLSVVNSLPRLPTGESEEPVSDH